MSALSIQPTYPIFTETDGLPLENGYIWIGTANLDPQGNPINVYWDAALTIAAPQPIRTINGYPSRSGTPARLYVNSDYSIRVQDSKGSLAYSAPEALERYSSDLISFTGFKGQVGVIADLANDDGSDWIGFTPAGSDSVSRSAQDKLREVVSVKDFGAVGDGVTDDTTALNNAFTAAVGKVLLLGPNETYSITSVTIPAGVTMIANGSVFRKAAASGTAAIIVQGGFEADLLSLSSPGSSVDNGIRVTGGNVRIGRLVSTSDAVDSNIGIQFQSTDSSALERIVVNAIEVQNFEAGALIFYVGDSNFNNIRITRYRIGVYLRDVYRTNFDGANMTLTSPSATGSAGQNGLLVESTLSAGSANNLRFSNWTVVNAAEHSYRFGGQLTIQDVWLTNCRSTLSGNGGTSATGGSGFKVLGATSVTGQRHRDFFFENCIVEDVSTTGTGVGNFCGFLISVADNIHISNCSVLKRTNTYSCWHGYSLESVTGVFLTNNYCEDSREHGLRIVASVYAINPGWDGINKDISVVGGYYGIEDSITTSAVFRLNADGATTPGSVENMTISGARFSGGSAAVRAETGLTYTNNYFGLSYINGKALATQPPFLGPNDIVYNVIAPWSSAFGSTAANSSIYQDITNGFVRIRKAGAWVTL